MGSNLVVVALPADDEVVWKVSSEVKPHLTMLFLGESDSNPNTERIVEFVQHAIDVSEHGPFYMDVDYRGTLGPDEADVLFFRGGWSAKWITQFRSQLLQNTDIKSAYDSTQQYPEWQPHLTLGYPTAPAHEDKMPEYGLNGIRFDRIAVWTTDFDGPEFRLQWPEYDGLAEVAWSAQRERGVQFTHAMKLDEEPLDLEALLEHHGVKGMKWGVRKAKDTQVTTSSGKTKMVTAKKAGKLDAKFQGKVHSVNTFVDLHNKAADGVNKEIPAFNKRFADKYGAKKMDSGVLWNEHDPITKEYHTAYNEMFTKHLNKAAADMGTSPTGKFKVVIQTENKQSISEFGWQATTDKVTHAATDTQNVLVFVAKLDTNGHIMTVTPQELTMAQTADLGAEFLSHHGVKGMKWGVRKDRQGRDRWSPKGHSVKGDLAKAALLGPVSGAPAQVRLATRAVDNAPKAAKAVKNAPSAAKAAIKDAPNRAQDRAFKGHANSVTVVMHLTGTARDKMAKEELPAINAKYQGSAKIGGKNQNLVSLSRVPAQKAYKKEVQDAYLKHLNAAANEMKSPTGRKQYTIQAKSATRWKVKSVNVTHAAITEDEFEVEPIFDDQGFIVDIQLVGDTATHALTEGEEFVNELLHYGVKGMRWGVRKEAPSAVSPKAESRVPHGDKRKTKLVVQGGQNHPAHEDAIKAAEAKAKLAKSGPAALSNKELRDLKTRLELEQQTRQLASPAAKKWVKGFFKNQGNQQVNQFASAKVRKKLAY